MPRISKSTPVLFTIATRRTPKTFITVMITRVTIAMMRWLWRLFAMFQPMLLKAGISASGSVAQTAVTVMIPANK